MLSAVSALRDKSFTREEALAYFDALAAAPLESCLGRWRGYTLRTGHALDGVLEAYGWYGKDLTDADHVDPLLFKKPFGRGVMRVNPAPLPVGLLASHPRLFRPRIVSAAFRALSPLLQTTKPRARLRVVEHRGVRTTAMVYDDQPIVDTFREVDANTLLGHMDLRGMRDPFFFVLERER